MQIVGIAVGLYLLYFLVRFPVTSQVLGQHIYIGSVMVLYLLATCVSSLLAVWFRAIL